MIESKTIIAICNSDGKDNDSDVNNVEYSLFSTTCNAHIQLATFSVR